MVEGNLGRDEPEACCGALLATGRGAGLLLVIPSPSSLVRCTCEALASRLRCWRSLRACAACCSWCSRSASASSRRRLRVAQHRREGLPRVELRILVAARHEPRPGRALVFRNSPSALGQNQLEVDERDVGRPVSPSTPPVLETGDYGGGWSTVSRWLALYTLGRQDGAPTSLRGRRSRVLSCEQVGVCIDSLIGWSDVIMR